jgi:hypothetical protein
MSVKLAGATTKFTGYLTIYTGKADYGTDWSTLTLPAIHDNTFEIALYENTNAGGGAGIRFYFYANGQWQYNTLTAVS